VARATAIVILFVTLLDYKKEKSIVVFTLLTLVVLANKGNDNQAMMDLDAMPEKRKEVGCRDEGVLQDKGYTISL
jgi:hypothetical protein